MRFTLFSTLYPMILVKEVIFDHILKSRPVQRRKDTFTSAIKYRTDNSAVFR